MVFTLDEICRTEHLVLFDTNFLFPEVSIHNPECPYEFLNQFNTGRLDLIGYSLLLAKEFLKKKNLFTIQAVWDEYNEFVKILKKARGYNKKDEKWAEKKIKHKAGSKYAADSKFTKGMLSEINGFKGIIGDLFKVIKSFKKKINKKIVSPKQKAEYKYIYERINMLKFDDENLPSETDKLLCSAAICYSIFEKKNIGIISSDKHITGIVNASYQHLSGEFPAFSVSVYIPPLKKNDAFRKGNAFKKGDASILNTAAFYRIINKSQLKPNLENSLV